MGKFIIDMSINLKKKKETEMHAIKNTGALKKKKSLKCRKKTKENPCVFLYKGRIL